MPEPENPQERLIADLPILLVDDEPEVLTALQRTLTLGRPYTILTATRPSQAMTHLECQEFSAVVSDFRMPEMDGVEFLADVRRLWPNTERILLTAFADEEALERGINDAGVHRVMRKPWRAKPMLSVIEDAVLQSRLRREHAVLIERVRNRNEELSYLNELLADRVAEKDRAIIGFRRRWDAALNAISDPLVIVRDDLVVEGVNTAAGALADRPAESLEGTRCHQSLFGNASQCAGCPIEAGSGRIKSGGQVFDARAYPLPDGDKAHICVYRDLTERIAFEQESAHVDKMVAIGRLAGGVAHELNNPLHAILSFVQLAQKADVPAEKLTRYHEVIHESSLRCRDIVQSLRDFSRRDTPSDTKVVDLNQVCSKAVELFPQTESSLEHIAYEPEQPLCHGNANRLQQVLVNFLQNAVDASPATGVVRVSVEREGDEWLMAVEDQGDGVPDDDHAKILEPFFTTKPEGVGTGLGLAISDKILREHGGSLRVGAAALGGARFEARLPRVEDTPAERVSHE